MVKFLGIFKLVISILLPIAFYARYPICWDFYNSMQVKTTGQWDTSNNQTMFFLHGIIFGLAIVSIIKTRYVIGNYFLFIPLWFTFFDFVIHRSILGITDKVSADKLVLIASPILAAIIYIPYVIITRKVNKG